MKEFERWYGCDESNRDEFTQQVESLIGTHVRVGDEVLGYEVGTKDISILTVPPGPYVLRSSQGCVDSRDGTMPYFVAAKFEPIAIAKDGAGTIDLLQFEKEQVLILT